MSSEKTLVFEFAWQLLTHHKQYSKLDFEKYVFEKDSNGRFLDLYIEYKSGNKFWYLNGVRHRENGPAIEYSNGNKQWYLNDKLHREDGPAVEFIDGKKEWWINGEFISSNYIYEKEKFTTKIVRKIKFI